MKHRVIGATERFNKNVVTQLAQQGNSVSVTLFYVKFEPDYSIILYICACSACAQ